MKTNAMVPILAAGLLLVTGTIALAAQPTPIAVRPDAVTVGQLHCPTTYGIPASPPPVTPTAAVPIPVVLRTALSAYANEVVVLVAPPRSTCKAAIGADGSWEMTVTAPTDRQAIVRAQGPGGCYGCALNLAAARFPQAAVLLRQVCGSGCLPARPKGEIAASLGPDVVYFEDPPTTSNPYRIRGVVAFDGRVPSRPFALEATCALPSSSVFLCQPILASVLTEFGVKAHW